MAIASSRRANLAGAGGRTRSGVDRTKSGVSRTKSGVTLASIKVDATTKLLWVLAALTFFREVNRFSNRSIWLDDANSTTKFQPVVHHVVVEPVPKAMAPNMPEVEFPRACTGQDLDLIRLQLPSTMCLKKSKKLRTNQCSFNFATRCPNPVWYKNQYTKSASTDTSRLLEENQRQHNYVVTIGCGSNLHLAVNTLRMISGNPKFEASTFESSMQSSTLSLVSETTCPNLPHALSEESVVNDNALMHCVESKAESASQLQAVVQKLHWQDRLIVQDQSERKKFGSVLQEFFVDKHPTVSRSPVLIDMLRIGGDEMTARILTNEKLVLQSHVKYVEFEYSYKEGWKDQTLSGTVNLLRHHGFVCYWSGTHGHLWRLTDCFMSYYDKKFWSNVACVNLALAEPLAARMEEMAKQTLQKQHTIQYNTEKTVGTDGKVQAEEGTEGIIPIPKADTATDDTP